MVRKPKRKVQRIKAKIRRSRSVRRVRQKVMKRPIHKRPAKRIRRHPKAQVKKSVRTTRVRRIRHAPKRMRPKRHVRSKVLRRTRISSLRGTTHTSRKASRRPKAKPTRRTRTNKSAPRKKRAKRPVHTTLQQITHSLRNMVKRIRTRRPVKPLRKTPLKPMPAPPVMERKPTIRISVPAVQMPRTVASPIVQPTQIPIGSISHFYSHLSVAIIALTDTLRVGDTIHIKGHTSNFTQTIESMQNEHLPVNEGHAGQQIGVKVREKVRQGDIVYR